MTQENRKPAPVPAKRYGLKTLAEYLNLSPTTISLVLNQSPVANSIPQITRERVFAAAKKFDYRPNQAARAMRTNRTYTIGIITPEQTDAHFASVMMGIERYLIQAGYLYFTVSHLGKEELLEEYPRLLLGRSVEGFLLLNTTLPESFDIPTVAVSSDSGIPGVADISLDYHRAATISLKHLYDLRHRRIVFMRGAGQIG